MKLQPDRMEVQSVTGYGPGWLAINGERHFSSLLITSGGLRQNLSACTPEELTPKDFADLAELSVELVIYGSGPRLTFPPPAWLSPLMSRRIGLETMDTEAACRTYNILAGEGRNVAALLLLPPQN
ncbi:MAG: Mth938-like domain-containing protein [Alphaproteobacteria bacterium]|nr:Mth938-like domain-containing protein [Alphaproteobacteria bacterium]